jgi:hypothetical protein
MGNKTGMKNHECIGDHRRSDAGISAALCAKVDPSVDVKILLANSFPNYSIAVSFLFERRGSGLQTCPSTIEKLKSKGVHFCSATRLQS